MPRIQRLLLDLWEICGLSIYGLFKDACSQCKLCYELDSKMIMNGECDLEGVGHSLCEGAALPFIWQGWCKPEKQNLSSETVTICMKVCSGIGTPCRLQGKLKLVKVLISIADSIRLVKFN